jgi:Arc/MetJ family transcription regulator
MLYPLSYEGRGRGSVRAGQRVVVGCGRPGSWPACALRARSRSRDGRGVLPEGGCHLFHAVPMRSCSPERDTARGDLYRMASELCGSSGSRGRLLCGRDAISVAEAEVPATRSGRARALVYPWCMARTNIDIDDDACRVVMNRFHLTSKREAVNFALRAVAGEPLSLDDARRLRGSGWEGELETMRGSRVG